MLKNLTEYLRKKKYDIIIAHEISDHTYDPTYGLQTCTKYVEYVDFDKLLDAIDEFSKEFKEES
jgi:hypothetical protein